MAVTSITTCDLHDGDAPKATSHSFSIDNRSFEIDLCPKHLTEFNVTMGQFVAAARRGAVRAPSSGRRRGVVITPANRVSEIRKWARRNGMDVSAKGRIPFMIIEAFENSNTASANSDSAAEETDKPLVEPPAFVKEKTPGQLKRSDTPKTAAARSTGGRGRKSGVSVSVNGKPVQV